MPLNTRVKSGKLDGNASLNLAAFVKTLTEPQAERSDVQVCWEKARTPQQTRERVS